VRVIPEILVGPYIIGFDTLGYYVPNVLTWLRDGANIWRLLAVAPLFYVILMSFTAIGIPIVISLKVLPPLLHGLLGLTIFFYARKSLSWSCKKSLLVALVATLYFIALRVSWDMLRNELGLIILFTVLILIEKLVGHLKYGVFLSAAMVLVVLSNSLVAILMFAIVAVTVLSSYFNMRTFEIRRLVIVSLPAVLLFTMMVYANYLVSSSFSVSNGFPLKESEGFMALFGFVSYPDMVANILGFLVFAFLPLLPLVVSGARHFGLGLQIKAWILSIFIALFMTIISPNISVSILPHRWTLMLTYPFAFYTVEAVAHFRLNISKTIVGLTLASLTLGFVLLPNETPFPYYTLFPYYVPTSMLQNTVPSRDFEDSVNAMQWLESNMNCGEYLLAHDAFYGWSLLNLNSNQIIPSGYSNLGTMAKEAVQNGSIVQLYLIWWINGSGWHGQPTVSSSFEEVYASGKIAVYKYISRVHQNASNFNASRSIKY
jgi:hypothetical protein